jgi:hypothetical protein
MPLKTTIKSNLSFCLTSSSVQVSSDNSTTDNALYNVEFINTDSELLLISGDPGILVYRWSDFEQSIQQIHENESSPATVDIHPVTSFHPHPSPLETIEINCTSYDPRSNVLYAAAGDGFGCYQWDMTSLTLLGTFGGRGVHSDYLHVVKVVDDRVITGGEDGKMVSRCGWGL